jgi:DNA-binding transcriptional LysR family regulator
LQAVVLVDIEHHEGAEAGEQLFDSCLLILAQIDSATGSLVEESRLEGHLRVVVPPAFSTSILGPSMPEFLAEHPKLSIDVFLSSGTPDLIRDRLDLGLTIRDEPESKLPHLFPGECPRVLCASPAYLKEHGAPRSLEELQRHDCVASRLSQRAEVWEFRSGSSTRSVSVRIRMLSDNGEFQRQACLQGAGIGWFYEFHVRRDLEQGSLKRVLVNHIQ